MFEVCSEKEYLLFFLFIRMLQEKDIQTVEDVGEKTVLGNWCRGRYANELYPFILPRVSCSTVKIIRSAGKFKVLVE